ncbi:MAG: peptidoglycan-binding protein [Parasporobacterium sp.]|nr:peptidoglycan-binding protein [Parasporobacterium sp.]
MKKAIVLLMIFSLALCPILVSAAEAEEIEEVTAISEVYTDEAVEESFDALAIWLESGQVNDDVYTMQVMLSQLGYYEGSLDGDFGSFTEDAVIRFQQDNGLLVDGIVGDYTMDALQSKAGQQAQPAAAPAQEPAQTQEPAPAQLAAGSDLVRGATGGAVTDMQKILAQLGYYEGSLDGDFGAFTEDAVIRFQKEQGLWVDGVVGPQTMGMLLTLSGANAADEETQKTEAQKPEEEQQESKPQSGEQQDPAEETTEEDSKDDQEDTTEETGDLTEGMTGEEVLALQTKLAELGYSVEPDGVFGAQTTNAVKSFQELNGLYVDGVVGAQTTYKLANDPVVYTGPEVVYDGITLTEDIDAYMKNLVASVTTEDMTPAEKLWATFSYIADRGNYPYIQNRIPYYRGEDWPVVYAHDMMYLGGSYCHGYSSLFGYAAVLSGYDNVHWAQNGYHAWVDIDGLVYDPVFRDSSYNTLVYGWTYDKAIANNGFLGAGFEYMDSSDEGSYRFIKAPNF